MSELDDIKRELEALRRQQSDARRRSRLVAAGAVIVGAALSVGIWTTSTAAPGDPVPNQFASGQAITAQEMNENFGALATQTGELQGRVVRTNGALSISTSGTFCGGTTATDGAFTSATNVGVRAARDLCATACGSPTAHMCTAHEAGISAQLDLMPSTSHWILTNYSANGSELVVDCSMFTDASTLFGTVANGTLSPDRRPCSDSYPIACCN